ncbi:MAG: chemotaxis response regulator protein-glutamate methylesterase [Planctomycetota bacterium]
MKPIRVLVVDDAVVVRRVVADTLAADPDFEVVGTAANGRLALQRLERHDADVIVLDLEMPEMNGLETLLALRRIRPHLPVIIYSTLTEDGAEATLEALALGATDYVTKPSGAGSLDLAIRRLKDELLPKLKGLFARPAAAARQTPPPAPAGRIDIVVIGASTGGPNALAEIVPSFPSDLPVPILIVQHMPPLFTRRLAERLAARAEIPIEEGVACQVVAPARAWIAPGDHHLTVAPQAETVTLQLNQDPHENSCRPSVDVLFRSVARLYGPRALAVVLTGMGQDGLRGCQELRAAGAQIVVQDQSSSVVWGMPGVVASAGLADQVLPLAEIGPAIVRRVAARRSAAGRPRGPRNPETIGR